MHACPPPVPPRSADRARGRHPRNVTNPILPLAALVARTRYEDLPPRAVESAKTFILDTIGVGAGGASAPRVRELVATAASWGAGEEATVPFVMATECLRGEVGPEAFAGAVLTDPATHALAARIRVEQDTRS